MRFAALVALAILSGAGLALGLVALWDRRAAPPIIIRDPLPEEMIVVSVEGAVGTPGLYSLRGDARLADALNQAGGARPGADFREINLASRVSDGDRIVIPMLPEFNLPFGSPPSQASEPQSSSGGAGTGLIDINSATADELATLSGIGPVLAQRIIDDRNERGLFAAVEDLARVTGISAGMVAEIAGSITVRR